jgi:hypothetical protein
MVSPLLKLSVASKSVIAHSGAVALRALLRLSILGKDGVMYVVRVPLLMLVRVFFALFVLKHVSRSIFFFIASYTFLFILQSS